MKNVSFLMIALGTIFICQPLFAEDMPAADTQEAAAEAEATVATEPAAMDAAPVAMEEDTLDQDNLEFVSGEVSAADEAAQSVTVKLYGETEQDAMDKTLTVKLDETTDITDGEKDRDIKSLTAGTEVDVEYDPKTSKATYIFVY